MQLTCLSLGAYPLLRYSLEGDPFVLGTDFFHVFPFVGILETLTSPFLLLDSASVEEPDVSAGDHSANNNNNNNIKIMSE